MSIVTLLKILVYGLGILAESLGIWASTSRHRYRRREVRGSGLREVRGSGFRVECLGFGVLRVSRPDE